VDAPGLEVERASSLGNYGRTRDRHSLPTSEMTSILQNLWVDARADDLDRLSPAECMDSYATNIQSTRGNVLLVASDGHFPPPTENYFVNGSRVYWADMFSAKTALATDTASDSFGWMCSGVDSKRPCSNDIEAIKRAGAESWRVGWYCDQQLVCGWARWPVEYCLSQRALPRCKLYFERTIGIATTVLNFGKFCVVQSALYLPFNGTMQLWADVTFSSKLKHY